jgi:alpha-L-rhamnosidase
METQSEPQYFEMGLLSETDWKAQWITPELSVDEQAIKPASYLKKEFVLSETGNARLYITAHGIYKAYINGKPVTPQVFLPGNSQYSERIPYQTFDISMLVQTGTNVIEVTLVDGWYRGKNGILGKTNVFGTDISLLCQLEIDKQVVLCSDDTWLASQNGPVRETQISNGEVYDASLEEITAYHEVKVEDFGYEKLICSNSVPVLEQERLAAKLITTPNGEKLLDFGQNMAGYVTFTLNAHKGQKIRLAHGETLDKDGNFTQLNFQQPPKYEIVLKQEVNYTCKEGLNNHTPVGSFFGFRYALVDTEIEIDGSEFTAVAVYSDMEKVGWFSCSDPDVNQLFQNIDWSIKGNFLDVPTDCPTRERCGWAGDAQVFGYTGMYLYDIYPVYRRWLAEMRSAQTDDGMLLDFVPVRTPEVAKLQGSAGWGDCITIIPDHLAERYQDMTILQENYEAAKKLVNYNLKRAGKVPISQLLSFKKYKKYTLETGYHFGEWLEPGTSEATIFMKNMLICPVDVTTAYLSHSCKLLAQAAGKMNEKDAEKYYLDMEEKTRLAYYERSTHHGEIRSKRQCQYVRPIVFDLISKEEKQKAAKRLNELIVENDYHLNTGFLTTHALCGVLTDYGYNDTAYRLLLQKTIPSWLYSVTKGATTIWEKWDGIALDGTPNASQNHYSYGTVAGWLFDGVCGIKVKWGEITLKPHPNKKLQWAQAKYDSVYGIIESSWRYEEGKLIFDFTIPPNKTAKISLPNGENFSVDSGTHHYVLDATDL